MPETGDRLSHYRLLESIGEGGSGAVWKAVDEKLGREVAIKILPPAFARDPERLERFEREARAVAAINHPNIVTIHTVEEVDDVHFLTMELVRGKTLQMLIPSSGMGVNDLLSLALPITSAIGAAHERGVTHGDLKPGNIMIGEDERVKVLDFGLARFREPKPGSDPAEQPTRTLTRENRISGTMPYMSPEQIQGKPLDPRADIFSLGVVLYEMATGLTPFRGETSADVIASILRDRPRPVNKLRPTMPRQFARIVRHSLEKDPGRRFQTVLDLHNELEELKREVEREAAGGRGTSDLCSLAVLPLDNLSGDPAEDFFADGMTDALITDLAKIGALKVISRTSVMQYKGVKKPLREIARELGVDAIVEGSVVRAGDRVRIMAQLIDAATDDHLWAERYDRETRDVLTLQSELAQTIAAQVRVNLTAQEHDRLSQVRTVNPEAHEACLRGRHFWYKRTSEAVKKGLAYFKRAIELDPSYGPAYAGLADSYIVDGGRYVGVSPKEAYAQARSGALKALTIDDSLAEAHTSLAAVLTDFDWDWPRAEREYRRALELNPSYVTAHSWLAEHLSRMGRHEEAIREAERARELDPLSLITNVIVAWILFFARRYGDSIEEALNTLELDPDYPTAHRILGWAYEERREFDRAIAAHLTATSLAGNSPNFKGPLAHAYAVAGRKGEALAILDELMEISKRTPISAFDIALIHLGLGDQDRAFRWLERAHDERSDHIPYLGVNPRVDPLRSDPRFADLLQRLRLPEVAAAH